ncbi:MAG: FIST N-terminal domain-containing protein [Candidatus Eisenbacteria bacterium]
MIESPVMRWAEAHSTLEDPLLAAEEAADALRTRIGEGPVDLLLAFVTAPFVTAAEEVATRLRERLAPACLAGTSGGAVVTTVREIERGPAIALLGARLPGVRVKPFVLASAAWGEAMDDPAEFARHTPGVADAEVVLLFGDPFTLDAERVLAAFDRHAAGVRVVGGMASAGMRPNANMLLLNDWVAHEGGVGVALAGDLRVDAVVSQGCRPVGPSLTVTRAEQNILVELDGQPALERVEQVLRDLPAAEREMLKHGLYVGRPARGDASGRGDWLVRNLLGADRAQGLVAVGDLMRDRERLRLHVRDAVTATEDLEMLLSPQVFDAPASGGLMFTCNGRGRAFFGTPDRDITTLQQVLGGGVPMAGLFCAGEIGPIGDRNRLHGHTASIALVRPKGPERG